MRSEACTSAEQDTHMKLEKAVTEDDDNAARHCSVRCARAV